MAEEMRKKHLNYLFLNTGTAAAPTWARCKTSTDWAIAYHAEKEKKDYISYATPTELLKSYKPTISQSQTAIIGDAVYDYVAEMARKQKTGLEAVTQCMIVEQEKEGAANKAFMFDALITIETDDFVAGTITYTITQAGDRAFGTAAVENGTPVFTPEAV